MLTIFSTAKPFKGHFGVIQRNAITSWTLLRPKPEIILFGDEEGTADICRELSLRHVAQLARNEYDTPLLSDLFEKAKQLATYDLLCYVNADIILLDDFLRAVECMGQGRRPFLIVGQCWDLDLREPWDFAHPNWGGLLRDLAQHSGKLRPPSGVDYFVFPRCLFSDIAPFAIGRGAWDNWLVWHGSQLGAALVDATPVTMVIHQKHDYSHIRGELWPLGTEWKVNARLSGGWPHCYTSSHANYLMTHHGIRRLWVKPHFFRLLMQWNRCIYWPLLRWTRPLRVRFPALASTLRSLRGIMGRERSVN